MNGLGDGGDGDEEERLRTAVRGRLAGRSKVSFECASEDGARVLLGERALTREYVGSLSDDHSDQEYCRE